MRASESGGLDWCKAGFEPASASSKAGAHPLSYLLVGPRTVDALAPLPGFDPGNLVGSASVACWAESSEQVLIGLQPEAALVRRRPSLQSL